MSCLPIPSQLPGAQPLPGFDPFSATLHNVLAGEIREMREKLESLAEVLVCDEHFATAYLEQLQAFDYLIQHADECVNLLERIGRGEDSLSAISHIRLGAVQQRMRDALGSA
jgi:predicted RNA-binding protein with EMAP domain